MQTATARPFFPNDAVSLGRARGDFARIVRGLMVARDPFDALSLGLIRNSSERVQLATRAAVGAGNLADAEARGAFETVAVGWLESLRAVGAFDAMLPNMRVGAMEQKFAVSTTAIIADEVAEGRGTPVKALNLASIQPLKPRKVAAICVVTRELARTSEAEALIDAELRLAVAAGTDKVFLAALLAATTPVASSGMVADINALVHAVPLTRASRPHWVFTPACAKALAIARDGNNAPLWPGATPTGGSIYTYPMEVSDQLAANTGLFVDATQIAANGGTVELDSSNETSVEMTDTPTQNGIAGTGATLVSLWQANQTGIKAVRFFAFQTLRAGGISAVNNIAWA